MTTDGTTQSFYYSLTGVDPACTTGGDSAVPNSCGIHIHAGKTCADASLVLGHYFTGDVTDDPWVNDVDYQSDAHGFTSSTLHVDTGATAAQVNGRAMVIHAKDGSR